MNSFVPNSALFKIVLCESDNVTVNANGTKTVDITIPSDNNYTAVGVVGYWMSYTDVGDGDGQNSSDLNVYRLDVINSTTVRFAVKNMGSSLSKAKVHVKVLLVHT